MKKKIAFFILIILFVNVNIFSGTIYESSSGSGADVKIYLVKNRSEADLCVYVTSSQNSAKGKDHVWYYTNRGSQADIKIYFVSSRSQANVTVFIVKNESEAGWLKSNPFRGKFR